MKRVAMLPLLFATLPLLAQQTTGQTAGTRAHGSGFQSNPSQFNPYRPNAYGANSGDALPPPSWEIPRVSTPHWEIAPNIPIQPNPVQGNHVSHPHGAVGVGYVGLPYYADPFAFVDADTSDNTAQQQQPVQQGRPDYVPQQEYAAPENPPQEYPAARPPYNPQAYAAPAGNGAADDGLDHPEVTLVFKDGRPPMKVHSYVLTGSSVFVAEHGHQRVVPIADLDLPATVAQNREAGVDFVLPGNGK